MLENFNLFNLALLILPVLLALTGHEFAHAWAAHKLGDDTAKLAGRLTLNPLVHLDFFGTIFLLVTQLIGWAKPVPVNPRNFYRPGRDMALVALAGPGLNLILALAGVLVLKIVIHLDQVVSLPFFSKTIFLTCYLFVMINLALGFFNLLPLPPLDGFQIISLFLPPGWRYHLADRRYNFIFLAILVVLAYMGVFKYLFILLNFHVSNFIFS